MQISDAIRSRRSIRRFTDRPVSPEQIDALLAAATCAPNHRLTQPWRFYVLGPEARHAYGLALGERKARKIEDPAAKQAMRESVAAEHRALPCMLAIAVVANENPEIAEEDYASVMMGIQNLALTAVDIGLGTHIKTGGVMGDAAAREAAGVGDGERIVAIVNVGEPAELPPAKPRTAATELTKRMA
jgi:nitroreductase